MAAEIKPLRGAQPAKTTPTDKPVLVSKVEGIGDDINAATLINGGTGVISISDDKSVRIWQQRDSGQYWPSVCHFLPSVPTSFHYLPDLRFMFLGLDNGRVVEFTVAADYNSITQSSPPPDVTPHPLKCGKAVCDNCSSKRSCIPAMGFEFDVRVCDKCHTTISDQEMNGENRQSLAKFHEVKHSIINMDLDDETGLLLTVGQDRVMKIWEVSSLLN
ncbi:WD repeat and FYVE domain-containing protein 2-like [Portunus trituberculatus]|uniref:WD repeat and FYVE domain-containing protein 2-like n=1 Tax=Portunus trituberculatus TaxID=210409 RepID=UPI001E1CC32D|nr:WD repeat and FYVE domain-containing protein 2-like [Portunus trituberculatus]